MKQRYSSGFGVFLDMMNKESKKYQNIEPNAAMEAALDMPRVIKKLGGKIKLSALLSTIGKSIPMSHLLRLLKISELTGLLAIEASDSDKLIVLTKKGDSALKTEAQILKDLPNNVSIDIDRL